MTLNKEALEKARKAFRNEDANQIHDIYLSEAALAAPLEAAITAYLTSLPSARFEKLADEPRPEMPEGYNAPLPIKSTREQIAERLAAKSLPSAHGELVERWHPIETAPKDGRDLAFLGVRYDGAMVRDMGCWDKKWGWEFHLYKASEFVPSHWMPLPEPPTGGSHG